MPKRILFVEDEIEFLHAFTAHFQSFNNGVTTIGVNDFVPTDGGGAVEDQFFEYVRTLERDGCFDGALVDFDLSLMHNGVSQTLVLTALRRLGIPVCRYSKRGATAQSDRLKLLKRLMTDGPLAVPFNLDINLAEEPRLAAEWVLTLFASFAALADAITGLGQGADGPSSLLARALGENDAEVDFAGYREAYPYYFADLIQADDPIEDVVRKRRQSTQVAYWFVNCILTFPGPILNPGATAAVFGFEKVAALADKRLQPILDRCAYCGPFSTLNRYCWRQKILALLDDPAVADIVRDVYRDQGIAGDFRSLRYCLLNNRPMTPTEQSSRPDWIPAGATESYVERGLYKKLNPWITNK
jgi:hypothetical protein